MTRYPSPPFIMLTVFRPRFITTTYHPLFNNKSRKLSVIFIIVFLWQSAFFYKFSKNDTKLYHWQFKNPFGIRLEIDYPYDGIYIKGAIYVRKLLTGAMQIFINDFRFHFIRIDIKDF